MRKQLPPNTNWMYYLVLALVISGAAWAYFLPVELSVHGRGSVNFTGQPEAVSISDNVEVWAVAAKDFGEVKKGQHIMTVTAPGKGDGGKTPIASPADGVLIWQRDFIKGDAAGRGERLALVYPGEPVGVLVSLPQSEIGRVQCGMPVRISLDAFPYQNFGTLKGTVREFSYLGGRSGTDKQLAVIISVDEVPGGNIKLMPGMSANVDILVGKTTLLRKLML
ncbi:MAG: HlyD family efflux transporter periplasmic adaptor subunit [Bacillota bacterium]